MGHREKVGETAELEEGTGAARGEGTERLVERWGEVQYLLRKPPMQAADITRILGEAAQGQYFINMLESESSRLGMLRGALSRCVVLACVRAGAARQVASLPATASRSQKDLRIFDE